MSGAGPTPALGTLGRGVAASAAARLLQLLLSLVMLAAVGRLIGAEGFGVFAIALIAVAVGDVVVGGGLTESLVQRAEITRGHEDASFWSTLLAASALLGVGIAGAAPAAALFGQPRLADILPILLLVLPVGALAAVPYARLQRAMRFGAIAAVDSAASIASGIVGIALVLAGFGLWALVAAELLRVSLRSALLLRVARYRPGFAGRPRHVAQLFRFNAGTLGVRTLAMLDRMLPRVLIGALLGAQALGFYAIAWRLYEQMNGVLIYPLNAVALPVAARAQANPAALRGLLAQVARLSSAIAFPAYLGMAAIAPLLLPLIVGPGWGPSVMVLQILLLLGLRAALASLNSGVLRGLGRPELQALTLLIGVAFGAVLVPLAAPFGLVAVTLVVTARRFVTWPIAARHVQRLTGFDWRAQAREAWPTLVAALVMAGGVVLLQWLLAGRLAPLPLLALCVGAGMAVYPLLLLLLAPGLVRDLADRLRPRLRRVLGRVGLSRRAAGSGPA
jgi:PST family polysaccharide transporter